MVPAIEMVAGTQYQCNITNVATSLDSVKQGAIDIKPKTCIYQDHALSFLQLPTSALSVLKLAYHLLPVKMPSQSTTAVQLKGW